MPVSDVLFQPGRVVASPAALHLEFLIADSWHQPGPNGSALGLRHDFHEIETLPENDRTRYTITPQARKDLLTRLLKLNHHRAAEEAAKGMISPPAKPEKSDKPSGKNQQKSCCSAC